MYSSRKVDDLLLPAKLRALHWLWLVQAATGIDVLVVSTRRDNESQDWLYAQGRTAAQLAKVGIKLAPRPGLIVTNARGGQSIHNYDLAWDAVPLRNGKPIWQDVAAADRAVWTALGRIAEACGISWSGRWTGKLRELGHFQFTDGLTLPDLQAGQRPPDVLPGPMPQVEDLPLELRVRLT